MPYNANVPDASAANPRASLHRKLKIMAKKNTTTKTAITAKRTVTPFATTESNGAAPIPASVLPATTEKAKLPAKAKPAKKQPAKKAATPKAKKPAYSQEDIALRAYFIAEKRQQLGLPGDSHSDWIKAERQLRAESRAKSKPRDT
jgi:hypothetical protein